MARSKTITIEKYLPNTICHDVTGLVFSVSNVPALNSSDKERILIAGTKKISIQGDSSKNLSREAYPKSNMLLPGNTNKKMPFINKKRMMAI